ncbi:uncharacterized protein A4U43_C04F23080 [Asparagus officinalis]|uniref:Uncharacterized protein n=1 Tax=Asparagus officinalis TaxID=4686 RepID=A0A5P1F333_ASPOF|nr:uncharacterized protein A4U43_C04F23080 [Asparagus officinalis]
MSSIASSTKEMIEKRKKQNNQLVYPFLITCIYKDQKIPALCSDQMEKGRVALCDEKVRKNFGAKKNGESLAGQPSRQEREERMFY